MRSGTRSARCGASFGSWPNPAARRPWPPSRPARTSPIRGSAWRSSCAGGTATRQPSPADRPVSGSLRAMDRELQRAEADLLRTEEFERWALEVTSTRVEPFPWGVAFFNDDHALRFDSNLVWIDRPLHGVQVATLASEIEQVMRGCRHREARILDESDGTRVALGLAELGYAGDHLVVMAHRRMPDRPAEPGVVEEVDLEAIRP